MRNQWTIIYRHDNLFVMESFPKFEEEESLERKHSQWLENAKGALKAVGFGVVADLSGTALLHAMGIEIPPGMIAGGTTVAYLAAERMRNKKEE